MATAEQKLETARTALILEAPFIGHLAGNLKFKADDKCKTAWVDGRTMGYSPTFIAKLSINAIMVVIYHETMHVALGHPWRKGDRNHYYWNLAADKVINHELRMAGYKLPDGVFYAEGDEVGKSAEWVYAKNQQNQQQPQPQPQPGQQEENESEGQDEGSGSGDESGEEQDETGEESGEGNGDGEGDADGDETGEGQGTGAGSEYESPLGEVRDAPTGVDEDGDAAPTQEEWKDRVASAALFAEAQGKLSAGMKRMVEDVLAEDVDAYSILLRFIQEVNKADYSWSRPNVNYLSRRMYMPSLHTQQMGEMAVLVDTSGSVAGPELAKAKSIVEEVIREVNPAGISIYYSDAEVCRVDRFEAGDELDWQPQGGGGTDFRPALQAIENDENSPVCCIVITDMMGTFPAQEPGLPVIWLSTRYKSSVAPHGETVYVGV